MANEIFNGDNGTTLSVTIVDQKQNIVNLSVATSVELAIRLRGTPTIIQGTIVDAINGKVEFTLINDNIKLDGNYQLQTTVYFEDGKKFNSDKQSLYIDDTLRG